MDSVSLEQRIASLEAKVQALERQLQSIPGLRASLLWSDRPPLTPEELAAHEEVERYIREARAELDREMAQERADSAEDR